MADPKTLPLPPAQFFNTVTVRNSKREFYFDFGQLASIERSENFAHLIATLVTTPAHVKEILGLLQRVVDRYEETYGEIEDPQGRKEGVE